MTTITLPRATVEQTLEALENCSSEYGHRCNRCDSEVDEGGKVASALRAALAQQAEPAQEPVATLIAQRDALLEALKDIAGTDPVDAALDPQRAVRIARAAIKTVEGARDD